MVGTKQVDKPLYIRVFMIASYLCCTNMLPPMLAGRVLEAKEQYKDAIAAFAVSLSIAPDYAPSIVSTAGTLMKMGNKSLHIAKSFLMSALRLEPTNHEAWLNLGLIYKMEGSMQQAADAFQASHELKVSAPVQSFV